MATSSNQFRIKLFPSTAYNFTINWGDGNTEVYNQTTSSTEDLAGLTHTYASSGIYDIYVKENTPNGFSRLFFNGTINTSLSTDDVKIIDIIQWGKQSWSSFGSSFDGCLNLSAINTDGGNSTLSGASNFSFAWRNCSSLSSFPLIDTSNATNLSNTWNNCSSLMDFPSINTSKVTTFAAAWYNCRSLRSFPSITTSASNAFNTTWYNCESLTAFPLIDTQNATNFSFAWYNCTSLKEFPLLNTSKVSNFSYAWSNCDNLTGFPFINTLSGTNFSYTWTNCKKLSGSEFPTINMSKMTSGINCFANVKLSTTSYSSLLTSICATNFNSNVSFHGGNSTYNTPASAARSYLVNTKNWIITDGGYELGT